MSPSPGREHSDGQSARKSRTPVPPLAKMTRPLLVAALVTCSALSTPVSARQDEPTRREQFDRLSTSLANLSDEYTADTIGTISFLLLVMGWFIMSERSRAYLHTNRLARRAALTAIPSVALMNALLVSGVYTASQAKVRALERLNYLGPDYYGDDEITLTLLIANLAIHLVLFGTVVVLVWARKAHTRSPAPGAAE